MIKSRHAIFVLILLTVASCDPDEINPSFLHIPSISLKQENTQRGGNTSDIVDAWVYVNNKEIGVFELPATIPILENGENQIKVLAGIKKDGQSNKRIIYPFYTIYKETLLLKGGQTDTIRPVVEYFSSLNFAWLETFDNQTASLEGTSSSRTIDSVAFTNDQDEKLNLINNKFSAKIPLGKGPQIFEVATLQEMNLPQGKNIFLEVDYKSDIAVQFGIYPFNTADIYGLPILLAYPSKNWKKLYISLGEEVSAPKNNGATFKVFIYANHADSSQNAFIYLDELKVIHQ